MREYSREFQVRIYYFIPSHICICHIGEVQQGKEKGLIFGEGVYVSISNERGIVQTIFFPPPRKHASTMFCIDAVSLDIFTSRVLR